jgi:ABC-type methionine transport system permease subunit
VLLLIREADEVEAELESIEKTRDESKDINMKTAFAAPHVRWSVMLGVAMAFIQQWTGCNAVNMCKYLANKTIFSHICLPFYALMIGLQPLSRAMVPLSCT